MDLTEIERSQLHQQNNELDKLLAAVMPVTDLLKSSKYNYLSDDCLLQLQDFSQQLQAKRRQVVAELSARRERVEHHGKLTIVHRGKIRDRANLLRGTLKQATYHVERKRKVLVAEGIDENQVIELIPNYNAEPVRAEISALEAEMSGWGKFFREGRLSDLPELPDCMELQAA